MIMKSVYVLRGLPGSGKSTWTLAVPGAIVCSADDFFMKLGGGVYKHDPAKIGEAHAECFRKYLDALRDGKETVVCDNTNSTAAEISPYMLAAAAFGYEATIVLFRCDVETALSRNTHKVPASIMAQMARGIDHPLPPWWKVINSYDGKNITGQCCWWFQPGMLTAPGVPREKTRCTYQRGHDGKCSYEKDMPPGWMDGTATKLSTDEDS